MGRSKSHLIVGIIFTAIGLCLLTAMLFWTVSLEGYGITYEETVPKTYTFQSYQYFAGKTDHYLIYVEEEEKPLIIHGIYLRNTNDDILEQLPKGERLSCFVTEASKDKYAYDIAEIKSAKGDILTLDGYNAAGLSNQKVGCVLVAVFAAFFLLLGILFLVKFFFPKTLFWFFGYA